MVYAFGPIHIGKGVQHSRHVSMEAVNTADEVTTGTGTGTSSEGGSKKRLADCVCLVTGASRGIGKGIALELGAEGATVYVTGTSSRQSRSQKNGQEDEPGTVEDTVDEIRALGGNGIAVVCDHGKDDDVKRLFAQIQLEQGRLDILVNNAFRMPSGGVQKLYRKFWEQGADAWDTFHTVGLRSHYIASCYAMPLLLESRKTPKRNLPRPFIGMVSSFGGLTYTFNVPYGVGKAGVDRLAKDMAFELRSEDIAVVSFWPGVVETERTQAAVRNGEWDAFVGLPLDNAESPRFTGRAMVEVVLDPKNMLKSGQYQVVAELAEEYKFTDVNGKVPPSIRSLQFLLPTYAMDASMRKRIPSQWIPNVKLPFWVMAQGQPPQK